MAKSVKEPFDSTDSIFEVKLDGYRGIAVFDPSSAQAGDYSKC
jgi:ATP-dependent DNA ligase